MSRRQTLIVDKMKIASKPPPTSPTTKTKLPKHCFRSIHPNLGTLVKNHKDQANRWICRSAGTSISPSSKWTHYALKACMTTSEKVWIDLMYFWHIQSSGSWVINKSARVRQCMNSMNSNGIKPPPSAEG